MTCTNQQFCFGMTYLVMICKINANWKNSKAILTPLWTRIRSKPDSGVLFITDISLLMWFYKSLCSGKKSFKEQFESLRGLPLVIMPIVMKASFLRHAVIMLGVMPVSCWRIPVSGWRYTGIMPVSFRHHARSHAGVMDCHADLIPSVIPNTY